MQTSQQPHVIYVTSLPPSTNLYPSFKTTQSTTLGGLQLAFGVASIIFNSIGFVIPNVIFTVLDGVWGGIIYIIAGAFGIAAGRTRTKCTVITCMVMSIVAACVAGAAQIVCSAIGFALYSPMSYQPYPTPYTDTVTTNFNAAVNVMLLLLGLFEMVVAIWNSAICCQAACCGETGNMQIVGQPPYATNYQTAETRTVVQTVNHPAIPSGEFQNFSQPSAPYDGGRRAQTDRTYADYNTPSIAEQGGATANPPEYSRLPPGSPPVYNADSTVESDKAHLVE